jgi:hypothetical protein
MSVLFLLSLLQVVVKMVWMGYLGSVDGSSLEWKVVDHGMTSLVVDHVVMFAPKSFVRSIFGFISRSTIVILVV